MAIGNKTFGKTTSNNVLANWQTAELDNLLSIYAQNDYFGSKWQNNFETKHKHLSKI